MAASAPLYIGDESMSRPPSFTNSARTSADPVSNVCHVPSPMTGSFSPEEGMGRVIRVWAALASLLIINVALPAIRRSASRRLIGDHALIMPPSDAIAGHRPDPGDEHS